jgi:hypothetical protein
MVAFADYSLDKISTATDAVGDLYALVSPRVISLEGVSYGLTDAVDIGWRFGFNNAAYTTLEASPNGWLRLWGDDAFTETAAGSLYTAHDNLILAPWWQAQRTVEGIKTELLGSEGSYKRVVQWVNYASSAHTDTAHDKITYQAVLHQSPSKIEFRYGHTIATVGTPDRSGYGASCGTKVDTSSSLSGTTSDFFDAANTTTLNTIGAVTPDWPGSEVNSGGMPAGKTQYYFRFATRAGAGVPVVLADDASSGYDTFRPVLVCDERI